MSDEKPAFLGDRLERLIEFLTPNAYGETCGLEESDFADIRTAAHAIRDLSRLREALAITLRCATDRLADCPDFPIPVGEMSDTHRAIAAPAHHLGGALSFIRRTLEEVNEETPLVDERGEIIEKLRVELNEANKFSSWWKKQAGEDRNRYIEQTKILDEDWSQHYHTDMSAIRQALGMSDDASIPDMLVEIARRPAWRDVSEPPEAEAVYLVLMGGNRGARRAWYRPAYGRPRDWSGWYVNRADGEIEIKPVKWMEMPKHGD